METFVLYNEPLPSDTVLDFEPALFNTAEFVSLQSSTGWLCFCIRDPGRRAIIASLHVHIADGRARSPLLAPFGSLDFPEDIAPAVLYDFLAFVETELQARDVHDFLIRNPPRLYNTEFVALLETFLLNHGYVVQGAEAAAIIPVTDRAFDEGVHSSEALRLRQAHDAGLTFRVLPNDQLEHVYTFIEECHRTKGYSLSISRERLGETIRRFPDRYVLCAVTTGETMVAASVSVRVKKNILYNFLVNHDKQYNRFSPPVMLMEGLYNYCRDHRIGLFDLGTSALDGKPNFSLLDFKRRMGATTTSKLSFYKQFR